MVSAAGTMTLAVMPRASLGHTGSALNASAMTQAIYAAVVIAAPARICSSPEPAWSDHLLHVAAFAWVAAFFGFTALECGGLLCTPSREFVLQYHSLRHLLRVAD